MKKKQIEKLLREIGVRNIKRSQGNGWVMCSCPFAKWTHKNGQDSNPSFGVKVSSSEESGFNCFSCAKSGGSLTHLLDELDRLDRSNNYSSLKGFVQKNENSSESSYDSTYRLNKRDDDSLETGFVSRAERIYEKSKSLNGNKAKKDKKEDGNKDEGFDDLNFLNDLTEVDKEEMYKEGEAKRSMLANSELEVEDFKKGVPTYLTRKRGLTRKACKEWGLLTDFDKNGVKRIVFPIRDINQNLLAYSKRVTWDRPTCQWCGYNGPELSWSGECTKCDNNWIYPKYQHSKGFNRKHYLYGEHMIDESLSFGVVVEGNLDPIWLYKCGVKNAVSTLGSNPSKGWPDAENNNPGEQMYFLSQFFDNLIIMPDDDPAGQEWAYEIESFFANRFDLLETFRVECGDGKDPCDLSTDEVRKKLGEFPVMG